MVVVNFYIVVIPLPPIFFLIYILMEYLEPWLISLLSFMQNNKNNLIVLWKNIYIKIIDKIWYIDKTYSD